MPPRGTAPAVVLHVVMGGTHITAWRGGGLRHVTVAPVGVLVVSPTAVVLRLKVMLLLMVVLLLLLVMLLRGMVGGRPDVGAWRHLAL